MTASRARLAIGAAVGGAAATAVVGWGRARPPGGRRRWSRVNYRGAEVSLVAGPALAVGTAAGLAVTGLPARVRVGAVLATAGAGAFGLLDDLAGSTASKGFRGHLGALRAGEVTSGVVKIVGIGLAGVAGAATVSRSWLDGVVGGAAVAGSANLLNLLDLRPGRALKVGLLHAPLLVAAPPAAALAAPALGAATALLPADLAETTMLGDAGANALGAALGLAVVSVAPRPARVGYLLAVGALTLASERVSFTAVIERTPALRRLDSLGRRPALAPVT